MGIRTPECQRELVGVSAGSGAGSVFGVSTAFAFDGFTGSAGSGVSSTVVEVVDGLARLQPG
jgi:hypothetical protein